LNEEETRIELGEVLSPTDDYVFKLVFGDESGIDDLTELLKSVLQLSDDDYSEITIIDPHLLREYKEDKLGVLDVKVKTKSGKLVNVEIQVLPSPELRKRVVFYASKMLAGQAKSGEKYTNIKRVISIVITDHILIPESQKYHNRYTLYDPESCTEFSDILEIHAVELPKIPAATDGTQLWWWTKFLSAKSKEEFVMLAEQNPQVKKAVVRLMELSADQRTRSIVESRQKREWDIRAREKGIKVDVAREMLNDSVPIPNIMKYTGLTSEEIERLRAQ